MYPPAIDKVTVAVLDELFVTATLTVFFFSVFVPVLYNPITPDPAFVLEDDTPTVAVPVTL